MKILSKTFLSDNNVRELAGWLAPPTQADPSFKQWINSAQRG
jgi:hypothetical protein